MTALVEPRHDLSSTEIDAVEQSLYDFNRRAIGRSDGRGLGFVIRDDAGFRYINCGDWVDSCTAVVEHFDGRFEIIRWARHGQPHDLAPEEEAVGVAAMPEPLRATGS